jgi:protein-disulfide isomerase
MLNLKTLPAAFRRFGRDILGLKRLSPVVMGLIALAGFGGIAVAADGARTPKPVRTAQAAPTPEAALPSDPARDTALKTFLQKHFRIANPDLIKFGPAYESPINGLLARAVTISNEQGQSVNVTVFENRDGSSAIVGQYLDLTGDPWGRMDISKIHLEDRPTLGAADAPITIVEFADFECPYCSHAFSVIETMVSTTYKGRIKVIYKSYPLNVHPWAVKAADAAECARLQNPDTFWDFARYFYSNQGSITPKNVQDLIDKQAAKLKLDTASLKVCMDSPQTAQRVKQDQDDGNAVRVGSTPTFFVNGIPIVGLPDNKILDFVINDELTAKPAAR